MSYFEFFTKNMVTHSDAINGTCGSMCPQEEVTKRERERLVHVLEVADGQRRLVKSYSRSAADTTVAVPALLRPYPVLHNTVRYLLLEVVQRSDVPSPVVYDFVTDRLRAVRQDMTVQRLGPGQCAALLEPMVRFHLYYGYSLCDLPLKDFDPILNKKYLIECQKWFLSSCDALDLSKPREEDELAGAMAGLDIEGRGSGVLRCDRELMETLYILCNLDDVHPLLRYLSLPKDLKRSRRLWQAYRLGVSCLRGEQLRACRAVTVTVTMTAEPLALCALALHLPAMQRRGLQVLSHAYSSKTLTVPLEALCRWLRFGNVATAANVCRHYGVQLDGNVARFDRNLFKNDAPTMQPRKLLELHDKLDLTVDHIFTY